MRIPDHALNRLSLLKAIRRSGPVARSELTGLTELSSGSITQLTGDLLRRGLIIERKEATKRTGRPRSFLEINAGGAVVVGASLAGVGKLDVAFIDLMGNRLHATEMRLGVHTSLSTMASALAEKLAETITESPFAAGDISRIGIALPALVDRTKGEVHYMTTFAPDEPVPFAGPISARLGLPVTIENDISCMARAEHWFGRARDLETFTLIHVGFAIGSAQYADGLPRAGANGLNAELGHVKSVVGAAARPCFCGGHGCLTAYASMYGMLEAASELSGTPFPPTGSLSERFEQFIDRADAGDVAVQDALRQAGAYLGLALANLVNATDPGNILISFTSSRFMAAVAEPMHQALRAHAMPGMLAGTKIDMLIAEADWRWRGTAALALEQTYLGGSSAPIRVDI